MRALDAPRARVLHDAAPEPTRWPPWLWPTRQHLATHSPPRSIAPSHPGTLQRRRQGIFGGTPASTARLCHGRRRQSHLRSPARPWSSAHSSASSCRHPQPRHVALQATERRFAGELIRPPRNRPRRAIKGGPRASPSTQATLECSPSSPMAANRPGEVFFPTSGNCGRHHCPGQFGTTRASPSPFSPPRASSSSREPFPLLDFDRGSLRENFHSAPEASSAAKLAAGSSLRPHRPGNHREDRTGVAHPSPPSGPREELPVAGDDRLSSASARDRGRRGKERLVKPD